MPTTPWAERPIEHARLLNPAFLGLLICEGSRGYSSVREEGMPYALAFLASPIVLHKKTRELLPRAVSTSLAAWLSENPIAEVGFAERAKTLVGPTREAIIYACNAKIVSLQESRLLGTRRPKGYGAFERGASEEVKKCLKKAEFLGKWFANASDSTTTLALWGVTP